MKNLYFKSIAVMVGVLAMAFSISYIAWAVWQPPGAEPPLENVPPPINVGSEAQEKAGKLTIEVLETATSTGSALIIKNGGDLEIRTPDNKGKALLYVNSDGVLTTPGNLTVGGNINYTGQLSKLDVANNFTATVRAADFKLGYSTRRGTPGRALVDLGGSLALNYAGDWGKTEIHGETTYISGNVSIGITDPGTYKLKVDGSGNITSNLTVGGTIKASHYRDSGGGALIRSSDGSINVAEDEDGSWNLTTTFTDNYVSGISFDTKTGVLTLTRTGGLPDLTQDLDGRYLTSYTESDPKVGTLTTNYVPKWGDTALTDSSIYIDADGKVGIGTPDPGSNKLKVSGDTAMVGNLFVSGGAYEDRDMGEKFCVDVGTIRRTYISADDICKYAGAERCVGFGGLRNPMIKKCSSRTCSSGCSDVQRVRSCSEQVFIDYAIGIEIGRVVCRFAKPTFVVENGYTGVGTNPDTSGTYGLTVGNSTNPVGIKTDGTLYVKGNTIFNNVSYSWPSSITSNGYLQTDASGNLRWSVIDIGVSSVTSSDGSLSVSPTTGDVVIDLNTGHSNTWTAQQNFNATVTFPGSGIWDSSGKVGIGTEKPQGLLTLEEKNKKNIFSQPKSWSFVSGSKAPFPAIFDVYRVNNDDVSKYPLYLDIVTGVSYGKVSGLGGGVIRFLTLPAGGPSHNTAIERMRITQEGNVGIGTTDPGTYKLKVDGSGNITGNLTVGGELTVEGSTTTINTVKYIWPSSATTDRYLKLTAGNKLSWEEVSIPPQFWATSSTSKGDILHPTGQFDKNKFVIRDDGNVGIGTDNPGQRLDVEGNIRLLKTGSGNNLYPSSDLILQARGGEQRAGLRPLGLGGGATTYFDRNFVIRNIGMMALNVPHIGRLNLPHGPKRIDSCRLGIINNAGSELMSIMESGNVGIGDAGPDAKLDIAGDGSVTPFRVDDSGDGDSTPFIINNSGNVGIGTTGPNDKLEVAGGIRVDDYIRARDSGGLALKTDEGTTRLFIKDDGNVGIGTTDPDSHFKLTIKDKGIKATNTGNQPTLYLEDESEDRTPFVLDADGNLTVGGTVTANTLTDGTFSVTSGVITGASGNISMWTNDVGYLTSYTESDPTLTDDGAVTIGDGTSGSITLTFEADTGTDGTIAWDGTNDEFEIMNGNVGIGTAGPNDKLEVAGGIRVDDYIRARDSGGLALKTDEGTTRLFIKDDGNVGIGTMDPKAKLDVAGAIKIATSTYTGGTIQVDGFACVDMDSEKIGDDVCDESHRGIIRIRETTCGTNKRDSLCYCGLYDGDYKWICLISCPEE